MDIVTRFTKARTSLLLGNPFFRTLALQLEFKEDPTVEMCESDGITLAVNPVAIKDLTDHQLQSVLAQTVMHLALQHHLRQGERNDQQWQVACDMAIYPFIHDAGFDPLGCPPPLPGMGGSTAERIYAALPPPPAPPPGSGSSENEDDDGETQGQGQGQGEGDDGDDGQSGQGDQNGDSPYDSPNSSNAKNNKNLSESENNQQRHEWSTATAQAAVAAKQAGKLPGGMNSLLDEIGETQIPWQTLLLKFLSEPKEMDQTWNRPNKRFIHQNIFLPSNAGSGGGEIVVAIDTSGSLSPRELSEFNTELQAIIDEVNPTKTIIIYCDYDVQHVDEYMANETIELKMHGGGGTRFSPPFEWVVEHGLDPKCLVYFTDGYADFDFEPPASLPVLWCVNNYDITPPWGDHIILDSNA